MAALAAVLAVFALAALLLLGSIAALARTGVPVKASSDVAIAAALDLLALKDGETFADLGCGFGDVLLAAVARARVRAVGFELNPAVALAARARTLGKPVRVRMRDARRASLEGVDAAYAYLMPAAMAQLADVLERRLKPGARVVSVDFAIPDWQPVETREVGPLRQPVRLYVVGRHRAPPHTS